MSTPEQRKRYRRKELSGFPAEYQFETKEQVDAYFSGSSIQCLRCGKRYRKLGVHLKASHDMEVDEYKKIYGLPWSRGLACEETSNLHAEHAKELQASGVLQSDPEMLKVAQSTKHRPLTPMARDLMEKNLERMNAGKSGEDTKRRKAQTKVGSPEYAEKIRSIRKRTVSKNFKDFWKGRKQTPAHTQKRVESYIRNKLTKREE